MMTARQIEKSELIQQKGRPYIDIPKSNDYLIDEDEDHEDRQDGNSENLESTYKDCSEGKFSKNTSLARKSKEQRSGRPVCSP